MKKKLSTILALSLFCSVFPLSACNDNGINGFNENVLRIASWDEYIDMGGDLYMGDDEDLVDFRNWYEELFPTVKLTETKPIYEEFEAWYNKKYGKNLKVEYVALQDNETMYNKIKMGDKYDLLCPSEYMAMKLKAENKLIPFDSEFFIPNEENFYAANVSAYTRDTFIKKAELDGYMAGYMWGTTGFVYNPDAIGSTPEESRKIMESWHCLTSERCKRKITAKDNARDSYFMGLGMRFEEELLKLDSTDENYEDILAETMNKTDSQTVSEVKKCLQEARRDLYGLETDEAKMDMIMGALDASYQWSGDAVFIMDEAERESDLYLEYSIPKSASNIWFDGWVMMDGANTHAATAFVNYVSRPQNVVRNMYYIGYTSCIAGEDVFSYIDYNYSAEPTENATLYDYDLSYFFGENHVLKVDEEARRRQLFAQYPEETDTKRLVVMKYFDQEANQRVNRMWNTIK